ncbi:MAG TPA: HmuY family protein [Chitinophagaceae bacterium]|nr:HmuY family protein [Chitinophagaceae bacterium]
MKTQLIALTALTGILLASCDKDDVPAPVTVQTKSVNNLPADTIVGISSMGQPYGSGKYTLYSLETNAVIANTDSATAKWDIGFRGTTIIINGGNSGPGAGGAFVYTGTFSDLKTIPVDSTFRVDNAPTSYAIRTGSGNGWYNYNGATQLITPIPGRILVVRTATGKYAKIEIQNYYKGGVTPDATASDNVKLTTQRYYTFRYSYQSDGSKNF